ncbi:hypothetical protein EIW28_10240 [Glycomyces terrestris]|uniref:Copper resistance protein CopC n=1 Tax=Glycomyces terrestris TaxID=2493553 RepID=A0A426UWW6_9ACTN|nr:hypothetical protein EIW28_10240 [Glycomyces terrestris]
MTYRLRTPRRSSARSPRTARHGAAPRRRRAARLAWSSLAAALIGVLWASAASAHAAATETSPASGAVLDAAPSEVVVEFNEPVTPVDAGTGVVAPDGDRADTDVVRSEDGTTVTIAVDADQEGTYLVGYRVVSDDGHPVSGTFTYSVVTQTEAPSAEALTAAGTDPLVQALLYGNRWFGYAALALALGAGVLLVAGARPREAAAKLVALGLAVVAMTAVLGLPLQTAYETGTTVTDLDAAGLQSVMQSNIGLAALLRLLLVLLALPLMRALVTGEGASGRAVVAGLAGVGLALGATWPLAGHPMAADPVVVAFIADWVHLVTALAWGGGVFALLILACRKDAEIPDRAAEVWIALVPWLLANLIVAGIASSLLHIDSVEALTQTRYGRLVLLKAGVLVVIVAIGLLTRRALVRGAEGRRRLRLMAGAETVFLAVVLGAVAVLVQAVPAKTALLEAETSASASTETATLVTTEVYTAQLVLEPGRPGANSVRILADDLGGAAFEAVEWEASYGLEGEEPEELRLIELRTGILAGEVNLGEAGRWVFTFTLIDAAGATATAEAAVDVSLPGAERGLGVAPQALAPGGEVPFEVLGEEPGGVVRQGRVVPVPAHGDRGHERRVGLDQDQFGRRDRGGVAQVLGVLEGDVPGEAHEEPAPCALLRERGVAGEAVQHHAVGGAVGVEDRQDVLVRVPVVDDEGLAAALRDLDVGAEGALLRGPAGLVGAEVVEAGLAERGHARERGGRVDLGEGRVEVAQARGVVGVQGGGGQDARVGGRERGGPARGRGVGADLDDARDPRGLGLVEAREDLGRVGCGHGRLLVGAERVDEVEVGVAVGDGERERLGRRRGFGSVHGSTMPRPARPPAGDRGATERRRGFGLSGTAAPGESRWAAGRYPIGPRRSAAPAPAGTRPAAPAPARPPRIRSEAPAVHARETSPHPIG